MTSQQLRDLLDEVEGIQLDNHVVAMAELRSVMTAVIEHLYYRQQEKERNEVR